MATLTSTIIPTRLEILQTYSHTRIDFNTIMKKKKKFLLYLLIPTSLTAVLNVGAKACFSITSINAMLFKSNIIEIKELFTLRNMKTINLGVRVHADFRLKPSR